MPDGCATLSSSRISLFRPRFFAGFKFIGNTALNLVAEGYEVPFGYEEAIGFMFGPQIRDKDGVAATASSLVFNNVWIKC